MIDCKITENYLKEKSRMCKSVDCIDCKIGVSFCGALITAVQIQKTIDTVQQWSNEHPIKTYLSDFLEKYPKAILDTDGTPLHICINSLYDTNQCIDYCKACWNTQIENTEEVSQ